ncbi:MAG: DUF460 domain-containing protein [Sulfolobales archaeon]
MSNNISEEIVVAGIDLFRGSVLSREGAYYSVCIMSRDRVLYEGEDLSLPKLLRILHEYKPKYIVLDNLYELAPDQKGFNKILSLMPSSSEIILATYDPVEGYRELREIASKYGLYDLRKKPDSLSTARILARLGLLGVGFKIRVWEESVRIIVSRNRSSRAGGSSEDRFKRASRAYVLRITRKIKDSLDRAGIPYEMIIRRSSGGIERAVFLVNASRDKLAGIVRPMKGRYVRVVIKPTVRSILNLPKETLTQRIPIIVGIDPGINYGIAIIDLNGIIQATYTIPSGDLSIIIPRITKHGSPIVIATDKKPTPESVRRIASIFGAKVYEPDYIPSDSEKESLIRDLNYKPLTTHERDALYAAISFYRRIQSKLQQIDRIVRELNLKIDTSRVKSDVIKGLDIASAIERVFEELLQETETRGEIVIRDFIKELIASDSRIKRLEEEYNKILVENKRLRERVNELNRLSTALQLELEFLKREIKSDVLRDREVSLLSERLNICLNNTRDLQEAIEFLKREIESLKNKILEASEGRYISMSVVREPRELTKENIDLLTFTLKDRDIRMTIIESVVSPEILRDLFEKYRGSKVIVLTPKKCEKHYIGDELEHVICMNLPSDFVVLRVGDRIILRREILNKVLSEYQVIHENLPKRIIRSEEELLKLIDEYRSRRS